MTWDTVQQLVRILMQLGAGFLVQRGLITEAMTTTLVGSGVSLLGIVWWMVWDRTRPADPTALR
jgi:hypothetical protein